MRLGWLLVLFASCTKSNPAATCTNGSCIDPAFPYCDSDGTIGGEPGTCIAVSCTPGEIKQCKGDMAVTCASSGLGYELTPCDLSCADLPEPHCKYLQPKYLPTICDTPATDDVVFSSSGSLDPSVDNTCTGGIIPQGGADLCVVRGRTIKIAAGSEITVSGSRFMNGRAIAFVADDALTVSGTIDVSGHKAVNGPGGGTFVSGGGYVYNQQTMTIFGAGGAGGATAGGAGGSSQGGTGAQGAAMNGGASAMNPALLASFVGGASSARPGDAGTTPDPTYGGGGGALMLVSCHGDVLVDGVINAGGGGGGGGFTTLIPFPGSGGGAGGNVVLQGRHVSVTGEVYANGGGGGEGAASGTGVGLAGSDGPRSDAHGAVGGNVTNAAGDGGSGGWIGGSPTGGMPPTATGNDPGGGGGSVGFLQTYTPDGVTPTLTPSHVSPAFQPNGTVELR